MINTIERVNIKNLVVEEPKTKLEPFVPEEQFTDEDIKKARKFLERKDFNSELAYRMFVMFGENKFVLTEEAEDVLNVGLQALKMFGNDSHVSAVLMASQLNPDYLEKVAPTQEDLDLIFDHFTKVKDSGFLAEDFANLKVAFPNIFEKLNLDKNHFLSRLNNDTTVNRLMTAASIRIMFPDTDPSSLLGREEISSYMKLFKDAKGVEIFEGAIRWAYYLSVFLAKEIRTENGRLVLGYGKILDEDVVLPLPESGRF